MYWPDRVSHDSLLASLITIGALLIGATALWDSRRETGARKTWAKRIGVAMLVLAVLLSPFACLSLWLDSPQGRDYAIGYLMKNGRTEAAVALAQRRDAWHLIPYVFKYNRSTDFNPLFQAADTNYRRSLVVEMQASVDLPSALKLARSVDKSQQPILLESVFKKWNAPQWDNIPDDVDAFRELTAAGRELKGPRWPDLRMIVSGLAWHGKRNIAIAVSSELADSDRCGVFTNLAAQASSKDQAREDWAKALEIANRVVKAAASSTQTSHEDVFLWMHTLRRMLQHLPAEGDAFERSTLHELVRNLGARGRDPVSDPLWMVRLNNEVGLWRYVKEAAEANQLIRGCWSTLTASPPSPARTKLIDAWLQTLKNGHPDGRLGVDGSAQPPGPLP